MIFMSAGVTEPLVVPGRLEIGESPPSIGHQRFPADAIGIHAKNKGVGDIIIGIEEDGDVVTSGELVVTSQGRDHEIVFTGYTLDRHVKEVVIVNHPDLGLTLRFYRIYGELLPEAGHHLGFLPDGFI